MDYHFPMAHHMSQNRINPLGKNVLCLGTIKYCCAVIFCHIYSFVSHKNFVRYTYTIHRAQLTLVLVIICSLHRNAASILQYHYYDGVNFGLKWAGTSPHNHRYGEILLSRESRSPRFLPNMIGLAYAISVGVSSTHIQLDDELCFCLVPSYLISSF